VYGLLADDDRRRVFAALVLGAGDVAEVARAAGLEPRTVLVCLARLENAGVVGKDADRWSVRADVLRERARESAEQPVAYEEDGLAPRPAAVLRAFLRDGRLVSIPSSRSKRLVVLDHVARVFELGVRYPEREVDTLLRAFHPDHAALRRYLVDEQFLSREHSIYWRTGGTVEV
jgi:hypothetical protein